MKSKIIGLLLLAAVPILAFAGVASAQTFRSGETTNVASGETIDGSVWIAGSTIDIAGKVNGDVFCAGQTVTVSGEVDGDVLCAGQTVSVSGKVNGNVRLAGQTVTISGDISGDATGAGQSVTLEGQGKIGRDLSMFGQSATINGSVSRDVVVASASATIGSAIGRNVVATVDKLMLTDGAKVAGYVGYTSPQRLTMAQGAQIGGDVRYNEIKPEDRPDAGYNAAGVLLWMTMLVVSAVVFALVFPRELHTVTNAGVASVSNALMAVLVGLIAGVVMPFAIILLMITILGIPFALVVLVAWTLIVMLSGVFAAYYLGRIIWRQQTNAVLTMLVGALVVAIALQIPFLNVIVWLLAVWYGSGALLLELKNHAAAPRYDMKKLKARGKA